MSNGIGEVTLPHLRSTDRFFGGTTEISPLTSGESEVGQKRSDSSNNELIVSVKSIPLLKIEELMETKVSSQPKILAQELRATKHIYYSLLGMSITMTIAFALISIKKYWALFFLMPVFLGFVEMLITVMISRANNGHE